MSTPPCQRLGVVLGLLGCALAVLAGATACADPDRSAVADTVNPSATEPAPTSDATPIPAVYLMPAFPIDFARPIQLVHAGDNTNRVFVVEQPGRIKVLENQRDTKTAKMFLDIKDRVHSRGNEEGLLSLAFHPRFQENSTFYVYYTAARPRRGVVSRFRVFADDPGRADPRSEEVILEIPQPYSNHNGSTILFGPDGYLYISVGDGGYANDPHGHGQDLSTLLGTVLRIDVDRAAGSTPYAIPSDNPFVDRDGARPEIWAYGLRNVWRMSFDRETGRLWAGDVGQNRWEEIDIITRGGNYGWAAREGMHDFRGGEADPSMIDPVVEYARGEGISITGGAVYRGTKYPKLAGVYLYADYATGAIWGVRYENDAVVANEKVTAPSAGKHITSFDEGPDGELYVTAFTRIDGRKGRVYRVVSE